MKAALLSLFFVTSAAVAQWSTDPANPMVVSSAANEQRYMRAIADADSGYYVFWSDLRNDAQKADLYGQHFDSEGNALWTANGELLLDHPTRSINNVAPLLMPDGSVVLTYLSRVGTNGGDTLKAMRFDTDGNMLWTEPSVLLTGLDYRSLQVIPSDSCAYVMAYCESCGGGGYGCRMQRVRMDGTIQFPEAGQVATAHYGPFTIHPDGAGGLLHSIRCGNGAGTCLMAQRFDSTGTAVWDGYINLADAGGLNYAFATTMDQNRDQTAVWEVNGDLRMTRIDTLGQSLWSPAVQVASDLPSSGQANPAVVTNADALFVAWSDNRPPASNVDLYLQKYDLATGAEMWAADGIPVIQMNTYLPTTGIVASDSGGVVVTYEGNLNGYSAMRVRSDGTLAWPEPVALCAPAFNPAYERRVHLPDGNGGAVAFWESFAGDVYGARVYRNGRLYNDVGVTERGSARSIKAFPNPAHDRISFLIPNGEGIQRIELINSLGGVVGASPTTSSVELSMLPPGSYIARIHTTQAVHISHFVKQ